MKSCLSRSRSVAALCALSLAIGSALLCASGSRTAFAAPASAPGVPSGAPLVPPAPPVPPVLSINDPQNPLHLTADQQKKFVAAKMRLRAEGMALIADTTMTKEQKDKKFADDQAATIKEMRAMLTPAQQTQVDKRQAAEKKVLAMRQQAVQQSQFLKQQLSASITPAQKASLLAIDTSARKQSDAIRASTTLTPAQKQSQMMQLGASYKGKVDSTLNTPVQKRLMQKLLQIQDQERDAEMKAVHP